jgi:ArsR family transcriptional regulator
MRFDDIDKYKYYGGDFMKYLYAEYVPAFKAISDETRLKIIDMLSCGEMCACDILESFSISQSTLSYHMKNLVDSGLVNAVRDGAWMRYTLNKEKTNAVLEFLAEITSEKEDCICKRCKNKDGNN